MFYLFNWQLNTIYLKKWNLSNQIAIPGLESVWWRPVCWQLFKAMLHNKLPPGANAQCWQQTVTLFIYDIWTDSQLQSAKDETCNWCLALKSKTILTMPKQKKKQLLFHNFWHKDCELIIMGAVYSVKHVLQKKKLTHKGVFCFWAATLPLSEGGYKWLAVPCKEPCAAGRSHLLTGLQSSCVEI